MNSSTRRFFTVKSIQLRRGIAAARYTWKRDRLEDRYQTRSTTLVPLALIDPTSLRAIATPKGGCFDFLDVKLILELIFPSTARIHWWTNDETRFHRMVAEDWEPIEFTFSKTDGGWELVTEQMQICVHFNGCLDFYDRQGRLLRQEYPPQKRIAQDVLPQDRGWEHRAKLQPEEHIYGLGERATALNLRGRMSYRMWNTDLQGKYAPGEDPLYICIPVYIGLHAAGCYLVFYENPCDATFEFGEEAIADFKGGPLRYYVCLGKMLDLVDAYTQLTGRPALPPRWAFGYHHCRWGYEQESELRAAERRMEEHDIPIKAMHLDIDCLDDFKPFTIAADRFPTLKEFAQELSAKGIRLITILHSYVPAVDTDPFFQEGVKYKYFCTTEDGEPLIGPLWTGDAGYVDFTNPAARKWWSQQYQQLLDLGFSGFWHDMNEPAILTMWGDPTFPPYATYHDFDGEGGNHLEAHNLYGLQQAQAAYERLQELEPDKRPFILSRSGWAGLQKYAWTWTGDLVTGWNSLRQTVPTVLNLGLSGIPYSGPDIGGFLGKPSPELYLRWFQLSCFLPFCRTHGSKQNAPRVPWAYGERVLDIVRDFLTLRCALIPYFYTLAWESHQVGIPLVRPLFWDAPDRVDLWDVQDSFLLGDALLIAPIIVKTQKERVISLPPGDWYDFWSDKIWTEQTEITVSVTLDRIPVLVKAGSIIPMEAADILTLHCYPDREGNCTGTVYSDALDGYTLGRIDCFDLIHADGKWQLVWEGDGDFPFPYLAVQFTIYGIELTDVRADDTPIDFSDRIFSIAPFQSLVFTGTQQLGVDG